MADKKPKQVQCPDCDGRGVQSFGTEDVDCPSCDGKGTVPK
jgi:DnaJ-class molecular chaperone